MPIFQVSSRTARAGLPKKRATRLQRWHYAILRYSIGGLIIALLVLLLNSLGLSILFFLLLPVVLTFTTSRSRLSSLLHGSLLYNVLTIGLALLYYSTITGIQFFIHTPGFGLLFFYHGPPVAMIVLVTTTLAWAVILAPLYAYVQALIDQRFRGPDYEAAKAVEAFTSTLREEINLDKLRDGLLAVVQKTMQPQSLSVWVGTTIQDNTGSRPTQVELQKNDEYITIADNDPLIAYAIRPVPADSRYYLVWLYPPIRRGIAAALSSGQQRVIRRVPCPG
jgi:hypothetical protein